MNEFSFGPVWSYIWDNHVKITRNTAFVQKLLALKLLSKDNIKYGLSVEEIRKIMYTIHPGLILDGKHSNFLYGDRDLSTQLFESSKTGIVALKFKTGNGSHWVPVIKGYIELYKDRSLFDGIGHKLIFVTKENAEIIKRNHTRPCTKELCDLCFRRDWCTERQNGYFGRI